MTVQRTYRPSLLRIAGDPSAREAAARPAMYGVVTPREGGGGWGLVDGPVPMLAVMLEREPRWPGGAAIMRFNRAGHDPVLFLWDAVQGEWRQNADLLPEEVATLDRLDRHADQLATMPTVTEVPSAVLEAADRVIGAWGAAASSIKSPQIRELVDTTINVVTTLREAVSLEETPTPPTP